jgi:hypothetical protein
MRERPSPICTRRVPGYRYPNPSDRINTGGGQARRRRKPARHALQRATRPLRERQGPRALQQGDQHKLLIDFLRQPPESIGTEPDVVGMRGVKRASRLPDDPLAPQHVAAAFAELDEAIEQRGRIDAYAFHVYGSQGLACAHLSADERATPLQILRRVVGEGLELHPTRRDLQQLVRDLETAYLRLATSEPVRSQDLSEPQS